METETSNNITLIEENGILKIVGTEEALTSTTVLRILDMCAVSELDKDSFLKLGNLEELNIENCSKLVVLPPWIREFQALKRICLKGVSLCTKDDNMLYLPQYLEEMTISNSEIMHESDCFDDHSFDEMIKLRSVTIEDKRSFYSVKALPISLFACKSLEKLVVKYDGSLKQIPSSIQSLDNLKFIEIEDDYCHHEDFVSIPDYVLNLKNLESITIICRRGISLPASLKGSSKLKSFKIIGRSVNGFFKWENGLESLASFYFQNCIVDLNITKSLCNLDNIVDLDLRNSGLSVIPKSIDNLKNLEKLNVCYNSFTRLPESFGNLVNLKKISFDHNRLTKLPESIGNLVNLKEIYLEHNRLIELPDSIGNLFGAEKLDLSHNRLISLPESIGNLHNLKELRVCKNRLTTLPESIGNLKQLQYFYFEDNKLTSIPESIGNLTNIVEISFWSNKLITIPQSIGNLVNIKDVESSHNRLTKIPESIGNLVWLGKLDLSCNKLGSLPASIKNLVRLERLDLRFNRLNSLRELIADFVNLKELDLERNYLTKLPDSIKNLVRLEKLNLSRNRLTKLPESIGNLVNLKELQVFDNRLATISEAIGNLKELLLLNLKNNQLASLPQSVRNLTQLTLLNLEGNNILHLPEDGGLGRVELIRIFRDKIVIDLICVRFTPITENDVYNKLNQKRLCWNFEKLKTFKPKPVQKTNLDENGMIDALRKLVGRITADECNVMVEYIMKLYNPQKEYKRWKMDEKYVEETKNLLGNILESNSSCVDLSLIVEAIREYCPDRQMGELKQAYYMLQGSKSHSDDLEEFIDTHIAAEKEYLFDYAITPGRSRQSVHVLNHWKYKLRDVLGFDFEFKTRIGTMGQDPFQDSTANALDMFFSVFTPEYVIRTLTDAINSNKPVMCELMKMIVGDQKLTDEDRHRMGLVEGNLEYCSVNEKAVEYYLVNKNIVVRK